MNITPFTAQYTDYLRDESRKTGSADSISFPASTEDVKQILSEMNKKIIPVTVQGMRTGITAGAVPQGGHILNLTKMGNIRLIDKPARDGNPLISAGPGVILSALNEFIQGMDSEKPLFFPPDPTETSASLGGMVSCNASGARTFMYGPTRNYIEALQVVFADGSSAFLRRGVNKLSGRNFSITADSGKIYSGTAMDYRLPAVKNAAGYYAEENMDVPDLFIGSEGTLGVITEIWLKLIPAPASAWGAIVFFPDEKNAVKFVISVRGESLKPAAIEFFNNNALKLLANQRETNPVFKDIPAIQDSYNTAVYIEYHGANEDETGEAMTKASEHITSCGGSEDATWLATDKQGRARLKYFRHALPEAVNLLIDGRRKTVPGITKLGTDMAVPDRELEKMLDMYNRDLLESGLESVMFGHIGNNHVHVNILPRNASDYSRGKELYLNWARNIINWGGTVSAEHGIGKLKTDFLREMYGEKGIEQMKTVKRIFDPAWILNRGNLFKI